MELSHRNYASLFLNGAAIFILLGMIANTTIYRKRGRKDDKLFFFMMLADIAVALCDSVVALANGRDFTGAKALNLAGYTGIYLAESVVAYLMPLYLIYRYTRKEELYRRAACISIIPAGIVFAAYLIGLPFKLFLYVDDDNQYQYGKYYLIPLSVLLAYMLAGFIIPIVIKVKSGRLKHMHIWLYLLPVAGFAVPYVFKLAANASVVYAVIFAYLHMSAMNEEFFDDRYGREARL
ncbi:MAG: hypothetical protein IKO61_12240 [Lachnospiraceae bacterium]|nr:hypothetical protein [Lachnospiraceae bacterium]